MKPHPMIQKAASDLCARFDLHEYNPTPLVDLGALVANADGRVDTDELEALQQLLEPMLGARLNAELVGYLIQASLKVIDAAGEEARMRLLAEILMDCDAVEEGVIVALAVAHASDGISAAERSLIERLARTAALPLTRLEELNRQVKAAIEA
jgi:tellurite resistance protein